MHLILNGKVTHMLADDVLCLVVDDLVSFIGMTPVGDMVVNRFSDHPHLGASAIQLLAESHISVHYMWNVGEVWADVFSCGRFDESAVRDFLIQRLHISTVTMYTVLTRGSDGYQQNTNSEGHQH